MRCHIFSLLSVTAALLLVVAVSFAQTSERFRENGAFAPRAEMAQIGRYGNLQPAISTGAMRMDIPLLAYADEDFSIPVSIGYQYDGYKPARMSGSLGLGWALECGGVITREVRGLEDEYVGELVDLGTFGDKVTTFSAPMYGYYYTSKESSLDMSVVKVPRSTAGCSLEDNILYILQSGVQNDIPLYQKGGKAVYYDAQPDVFSFNFMGIRGKFCFSREGTVVFDTSSPKGEFSVSAVPLSLSMGVKSLAFKIVTGDGYEYMFGQTENSQEFAWSDVYKDEGANDPGYSQVYRTEGAGNVHVTAWRLSSITAPNGNKVTFRYDKGTYLLEPNISHSYTPVSRYYGSPEEDPTISYERRTFCGNYFNPLTSVEVNGHTVLSFEWEDEDTSTDECAKENFVDGTLIASYYTTEGPFPLKVKKRHLKGISLFNWDGIGTDCCAFRYGRLGSDTGVRKRLLKEVKSLSKGTYTFEYKMPALSLPPHDSKYEDMWGYWSASALDPRQYKTYDSLIDQLQYLDCAVPDYERTMTGALTLITYPTGGTSRITYEQNTASSGMEVDGTSAPGVKSLYTYNVPIGGLRVGRIENDANDGMSDSVAYTYYDNYDMAFGGPSSGVAMNIPRLSFEMSYLRYSSTVGGRVYLNGNHSGALGYSALISTFYLPSLPVFWTGGPQVTYRQVQEHFENGSVVNHIFSSYYDFPDIYDDSFVIAGTTDIAPLSDSQATRMWRMMCAPIHDRSALRGREMASTEYDSKLLKVKEILHTYNPNQCDMFEADCNDVLFWERHSILRYEPHLADVLSKNYEKTESGRTVCFESTATYRYNLYNQLSSVIRTAGSRTDKTDYVYSWETTSKDKSQFRAAVQEVAHSVNGRYADRVAYGYDNSIPCMMPQSVARYIYDTLSANKERYDRLISSRYEYNGKGRMTKANLPGNAYVLFEWDTDSRHIICKTENAISQKTSYSWADQIGLSSITHPSGQKESYTYDDKGRLSLVKNSFSEKIRRYEVHLASESSSSAVASNYIKEYNFISSNGDRYSLDADFYNGLGYLNLTRKYGYISGKEDLVCPVVYDKMRRAGAKEYLPFSAISVGSVADAIQKQRDWYNSNYADSIAYRETTYERAVSGRPLSSRNVGERYKRLDRKRGTEYGVNSATDSVYVLSYTDNGYIECTGVSLPETLRKQIFISEDADTSIVFSDILGREILSRQLDAGRRYDTYKIYDARDSLVCVISPKGSELLREGAEFGSESIVVEGLSYRYKYDGQGRLIEYHSPGGGLSAFAYDRRDRLVFFQDANMQFAGKGMYYLYDSAGRVIEEGTCTPKDSAEGIRSALIYGLDIKSLTSDRQPARMSGYYGEMTLPDRLVFEDVEGVVSHTDTSSLYCRGSLCYEKVYEAPYYLDESNLQTSDLYEERAYWYDKYGYLVQSLALSRDGWSKRDSYKYDFAGNVIAFSEEVIAPSGESHCLTTLYERDGRGRILSFDRTIDSTLLNSIQYGYDKLGQLIEKSAYAVGTSTPILSQSYDYSIQGWMKRCFVRTAHCDVFEEVLVRDSDDRGALFSGRIQSIGYQHFGGMPHRDEYSYDRLGRLLGNTHFEDGKRSYRGVENAIRHDANGNMTSLVKFNERGEDEPMQFAYNGNRRTEFRYDSNGNIITFGTSNIFNLPYGQGIYTYKYLSDGVKIEKRDTSGKGLRYCGVFVFNLTRSGISVESAASPEGRVYYKDGGEIVDEWFVKDHSGNVRSIVNLGADTAESAVLFESDYSPYGTRVITVKREDTDANRYGFGGKESAFEDNPDVFLDFGARYWSPVFYTWLSRDPKSDSYCSVSPYAYCAGDPVNFIDPDGKALYYTRTGDFLADDGEDDNRIFLMDDTDISSIYFYRFNKQLYDMRKSGNFVPYISGNLQEVDGLIIITRNEETDTYTAGKFKTVWKGKDNKITGIAGFTLERDGPDTTTPNMMKRIPEGLYQLYYYNSKKYPHHFGLYNELVPQNRYILMHTGNWFYNTKGCILLGTEYSNGVLGHSGDKVEEVNNYLNSVPDISNYFVIIRNRF